MTQVDFNEHWLYILQEFVQPMQQKIYTGYYSDVGLFGCLFRQISLSLVLT